jgi:hypothetical protein
VTPLWPNDRSHNRSNMKSKVTAVSYFNSGVIDTAVHVTVVSLIPLCKSQGCQDTALMSELCHWKRCSCHSCVNDIAVNDNVNGTALSDFCIKKQCFGSFAMIFDKVSLTLRWHLQQYHWHRCANHHCTFTWRVTYLGALKRGSNVSSSSTNSSSFRL